MNQNSPYFLLLFLCFSINTFLNAQQEQQNDSLAKYSYEELEKKFYNTRFTNKDLCRLYAEKYLFKAKLEGEQIKISKGYFHMAIFYYVVYNKDLTSIKYTDSIIEICKNCNDKDFPAMGYYTKGAYLYDSGHNKEALKPLLEALEILKTNNNVRLEIDTRNVIIGIKSNWSRDGETIKYEKELLNFIKKQNDYRNEFKHEYALAIKNLAISYISIGDYKKSLEIIETAIFEKVEAGRSVGYYDFVSIAGHIKYYLGEYKAAIDSSLKALPYLIKINDRNVIMDNYYLAKSYDKLNQPEKAQFHFLKTDSIYQATKDIFPEMRNAYEHIIEYYKSKNDLGNQIKYYDRLIETDKIIDSTYTYVTNTVEKKFDTPQAIAERARLVEEAKANESSWKYSFGIISVILSAISGVLFYVYRRQKFYKQRFENLMTKSSGKKKSISTALDVTDEKDTSEKKEIGISEAIVKSILKGLAKFEASEGYRKQVTLTELAKNLETNPKYLSKVINWHYQKNFTSYINELRVQYAISKLKEETVFRNYTIKAIAAEVGFKNAESFSKTFYKVTGIYPSYFIKQLSKWIES